MCLGELKIEVLCFKFCSRFIAQTRHGGDFNLEVLHTNECAEKILGFWNGVAEWGNAGDVFSWL